MHYIYTSVGIMLITIQIAHEHLYSATIFKNPFELQHKRHMFV